MRSRFSLATFLLAGCAGLLASTGCSDEHGCGGLLNPTKYKEGCGCVDTTEYGAVTSCGAPTWTPVYDPPPVARDGGDVEDGGLADDAGDVDATTPSDAGADAGDDDDDDDAG